MSYFITSSITHCQTNSGTIFSQGLSYDPASNLVSLTSTQNAAGNGTGGSETSNFCYDEQNRLVWAGNSGTQPGAGNGTCGSGTLASGLTGASYSNSYVYTHLGQLWQGPLPGGSTQEQYLYCASNTHQLVGLYPTTSGATCSNYSTKHADYSIGSYDGFGNVASRTAYSTTGTLTYDILDHLTQWSAGSNNQEQYLYDASGQRMLRRFTNNNGTTILTYPFGIEEHQYSGTGSNQWNISYYFLAGRLLGSLDGNGMQFYLTDSLGSLVSAFTNAQGGASMKSNQLFGPYGNVRYYAGNLNTAKGFLGQYNDGSGLDYFNARYYDPVVGVFMSADTVQGNLAGMNPYAYVNGNPETQSDPSGRMFIHPGGGGGVVGGGGGVGLTVSAPPTPQPSSCTFFCGLWNGAKGFAIGTVHVVAKVADFVTGASSMVNDVRTIFSSRASFWDKVGAGADLAINAASDVLMVTGIGEAARGAELLLKGGVDLGEHLVEGEGANTLEHVAADLGCGLSFAPATLVATAKGEQAIGTLHVGQKVWAYNPKTHKMEQEPILHVWINHDNDLVNLTLTTTTAAQHGKAATQTSETIHTNKKHPFLTKEKGFLPVGQIKLGMHVLRADGTYGVVTGWKVVPGAEVMYNLEVAQDHTFTVGIQQWVVHNCGGGLPDNAAFSQRTYSRSFVNGPNAGRSLPDVAMDLKSGVLSPANIEVNIVRRGANTLIVNTRSTVTLLMAGVDRSAWNVIDKTGEDTFEKAIDLHLTNNGLTEAGISFVKGPFGIFQL